MTKLDARYFFENVTNVNGTVEKILFGAASVPVVFIVLSFIGIWSVPHTYSISILVYILLAAVIMHVFRCKFDAQYVSMYWGVFSASIFVALLGFKGIISISISYAFGPMLSCMYYNRTFSRLTCVFNFILLLIICYLRSSSVLLVTEGFVERQRWFIQTVIGYIIESVFLFMITDGICLRIQRALKSLRNSIRERNEAYDSLHEKNQYIISVNSELEVKNRELDETQYKIIQFVAKCLGSHDLFTGRHVIHTQKYVEVICNELRDSGFYTEELTDQNIYLYQTAAFLHDIGKIHIPEGVLNKIGKFTNEEFELMKCHPEEGRKLLEFLPKIENGTFNEIATQMAYCHHEKWDGSGYPQGLAGTDIPLCARIMAAADVLDALISQRLYKDPMTVEEAMVVFQKSSGIHFEPCIADAVIRIASLIYLIDADFKTTEAASNAEELEWWQKYHQSLNK